MNFPKHDLRQWSENWKSNIFNEIENDLMKKERNDIQGLSHKDHHLLAIVIKYKILMTKASTNKPQFCPNKKEN